MNNVFKLELTTNRDLTGGNHLPLAYLSAHQITIPSYFHTTGFRALSLIDGMCMCCPFGLGGPPM